jgi:hypothetical protein
MTVTPADQYRMLVQSLHLAAAPPHAQVAALPDFVCLTCEISTLFTDAYLGPEREKAALVTADASAMLRRLDDFFAEIPTDAEISDVEILRSHWFWGGTPAGGRGVGHARRRRATTGTLTRDVG